MVDEEIQKLTDYEHQRLRTEMYFGSRSRHTQEVIFYDENGSPFLEKATWAPAVYTAFREIVDNALDEFSYGFGNRIDIEYDEENSTFSVQDNGRGIPIEFSKEFDEYIATMVLTTARSGRNFGERGDVVGTNGIGAATVNSCSEWFKVDIYRDKTHFFQKFEEGDGELKIHPPKINKVKTNKTSTRIQFKLSSKVFSNLTLPKEFVAARVYEIAFCNPLIKVYWQGSRVKVKPTPEKNLFPGIGDRPIIIDIKDKAEATRLKFLLKPNFCKSGEYCYSIVNNIPAFNGGIHVESFRRNFYSGLLRALTRESKKRKLQPNRSDINDSLLIYNITNMSAPNFDSQSKTRLINEELDKVIKDCFLDDKILKNLVRKNSGWIDQIYERCAARTQKKDAKETAKLARKLLRGKVPNLKDASGKDRTKCILFLGEGESAIAGMTEVRDPEIHGGLGLRGKILNVNGEKPKRVLDSQALANVMNSIGLVINEEVDRSKLRYGKIYIAHDMDEDGKNIGALLINFFYTYWPELFDQDQEPFVYIFNTPFIIAERGKTKKYWYARNYHEFDSKDYQGWEITRAKGLGTLLANDWKYSLENPELYAIVDDGKMEESLDLIFNGSRTDDRKTWIGL